MAGLRDYSHLFSIVDKEKDISDREWRALTGLSVAQTEDLRGRYWEAPIGSKPLKDKHLIWTLNFMKQYSSEDVMYRRWTKSKETYRYHVFKSIDFLSDNLDEVPFLFKILLAYFVFIRIQ